MTWNKILKVALWLTAILLFVKLFIVFFVEVWVEEKIKAELTKALENHSVEIGKVNIGLLSLSAGIEGLHIYKDSKESNVEKSLVQNSKKSSQRVDENDPIIYTKIESIKIKGIHPFEALLKNQVHISSVKFVNSDVKAKIPFSGDDNNSSNSSIDLIIGTITFENTNIKVNNMLDSLSLSITEGDLSIENLNTIQEESLTLKVVDAIDLKAKSIDVVNANGMYTFSADNFKQSSKSEILTISSLKIKPNYPDYEFTSLYKYQTDRLDIEANNIRIFNFIPLKYFKNDSLMATSINIENLNMDVFRDKRRPFKHEKKPTIQELMRKFPGYLRIDSVVCKGGKIVYSEHSKKAAEPGKISFNDLTASIYNLSNDTTTKNEDVFLEFDANALLMNAGKIAVLLKANRLSALSSFEVNGHLGNMELDKLNPMLENNSSIHIKSGNLGSMKFHFKANKTKATGETTILYNNLEVEVVGKSTELGESFLTFIANKKIIDANPLPDKSVKEGIIEYRRNPERFLFNYSFKSILSGIKNILTE